MKQPCVYIMTNKYHGTLYTGVTSDLIKRIYEHKNEITGGHTKTYGLKNLVWFEIHENMESAIRKEKLVKRWKREWKYNVIEKDNPLWKDLYSGLLEWAPQQVRGDELGVWGDGLGVWGDELSVQGNENIKTRHPALVAGSATSMEKL